MEFLENASIAAQVSEYLTGAGMSITSLAKEVGYSRPMLSRYLAGKYDLDTTVLEAKLAAWLEQNAGGAVAVPKPHGWKQRSAHFYESGDARAILGVCQAAQEYHEMGIITGRSGYGKSYALQEYAKLPKVGYMECDATMSPRDLLLEVEKALSLPTVSINNHGYTNHDRMERIAAHLKKNPGYLLIVDEADKLLNRRSTDKMDLLRSIFDKCGERGYSACGIVIAGEPGLSVSIKQHMPRYANRTLLGVELEGLSPADVTGYLSDYDIAPDALDELKRRALNSRNGCFRLLERTMRNVRHLMEDDPSKEITLPMIRQASSLMLL